MNRADAALLLIRTGQHTDDAPARAVALFTDGEVLQVEYDRAVAKLDEAYDALAGTREQVTT